jgi:hypothetical protein
VGKFPHRKSQCSCFGKVHESAAKSCSFPFPFPLSKKQVSESASKMRLKFLLSGQPFINDPDIQSNVEAYSDTRDPLRLKTIVTLLDQRYQNDKNYKDIRDLADEMAKKGVDEGDPDPHCP